MMAVFVMAALIIALSKAPVYEIRSDESRDYTDSCLVELEVNELHAGGRIELPDIGTVEEPALFVQHAGKCHTAPHLYAGLWELKISEAQAAQLAGIYGASGAPDLPYKYTSSPGAPYDGIPVRLLGRQNGRVIEVQDIADCDGYYESHLVTSYGGNLAMLALCGSVARIPAGISCAPADSSMLDNHARGMAGEHGNCRARRGGSPLGRAAGCCGGASGYHYRLVSFE